MKPASIQHCLHIGFMLLVFASSGFANEDYLRDVKIVLKNKCFACHGAIKQEAGLRLDTVASMLKGGDSGPVIVAGETSDSLLLERISAADESDRMPPEGAALSALQIQRIREWIRKGAPAPANETGQRHPRDHWAFQPVQKPDPPGARGINPIDGFIRRRLQARELKPSPPATRAKWIRRLFLDMHGLPPTPEQVDAFVADQDPQAFSKWVEYVLSSPRYGERWAQHWLDVVRYADTHGFEVNTPRPNAWPYRDYVIRSLNEDKPYDRFVREQIAGDQLGADAATGFLVAAAALLPGQIGQDDASKRLARQDALDEIIVGTSATFLGLTVGCARCHDHKFDPITQNDYYAMQAFFAGVEYGERPIQDANAPTRLAKARQLVPQIEQLKGRLLQYEPLAETRLHLLIDDRDSMAEALSEQQPVSVAYPAGKARGFRDDVGSRDRLPQLGGGQFSKYRNVPGRNLVAYRPGQVGRFRIWISWGAKNHPELTRDAHYLLDHDGDLETTTDQSAIATINQRQLAGDPQAAAVDKFRWSGFRDGGVHKLSKNSCVLIRCGETGKWLHCDCILLEEVTATGIVDAPLPRLRSPLNAARNVERFEPTRARFIRFTSYATIDDNRHEPCLDELEAYTAEIDAKNVAAASLGAKVRSSGNYSETGPHQLKHINDGLYGNEQSWISNEKGKGWVEIEFASPALIDRVVWGRDRNRRYQDRLPTDYRIEVAMERSQWTTVARSADRLPIGTPFELIASCARLHPEKGVQELVSLSDRLQALQTEKVALEKTPLVFAGIFGKPMETHVLHRGDPEQKKQRIQPAIPGLFASPPLDESASDPARRLALAGWLGSAQNPLTARVIVNRVWLQHFGRGLVETPSDFGLNAEPPSHPELLDWLAAELVESGWSLKHLHRLILNSETYRQSNRIDSRAQAIDQDNRLLWRYATRRLEAEAIRDSMLQVSGELNLKMGGPGFDFFKSRGGLNGFPAYESFRPEQLRRTIYAHKIRMESIPVFGAFDCPDAGRAMPMRNQSTTAIQALNLLNSPFVLQRSRALAKRLENGAKTDSQRVALAFRLVLAREPDEQEQKAAQATIEQYGTVALCRVLFISNEFLYFP